MHGAAPPASGRTNKCRNVPPPILTAARVGSGDLHLHESFPSLRVRRRIAFEPHPPERLLPGRRERQETGKADIEAATRLQVFLDRAEFAPGKIDGRYGEFTLKALALYRQARGGEPAPSPDKGKRKHDAAPDLSGLDLISIDPPFITYTVTEADLQNIGEVPASVPDQAKLKSLPYKNAVESIAEKFHSDVDFLAELNPGKTKAIKAGDRLSVPNVEPFELAAVKDLKPGSELAAKAANDLEDEPDAKNEKPDKDKKSSESTPPTTAVKIDTKTSMLAVYEGEKLIAAYPVTIGSAQTESPVGDWKVRGVAKMPNFRYDKAMLNKGERSADFHMLPPGPNNPVGVIWIALNKKGIGLHGSSDPDAIGRSASHGCVRLANWDVVRLAGKVKAGVPVAIH
jgi:lipoprotein-anchoring transpeptidase ErfK/SrfK